MMNLRMDDVMQQLWSAVHKLNKSIRILKILCYELKQHLPMDLQIQNNCNPWSSLTNSRDEKRNSRDEKKEEISIRGPQHFGLKKDTVVVHMTN